jgi:DNA-binding response OmpR family regulator
VRLAAREFELVALLATEPDRVFTKQELMRELWGRRGSFRTLDSHASRARCKLREAGAAGFVVNCHAHGYRFRDAGGQR